MVKTIIFITGHHKAEAVSYLPFLLRLNTWMSLGLGEGREDRITFVKKSERSKILKLFRKKS